MRGMTANVRRATTCPKASRRPVNWSSVTEADDLAVDHSWRRPSGGMGGFAGGEALDDAGGKALPLFDLESRGR